MAVPLVFNPTAGRGRAGRHIAAICATFRESGVEVSPTPSRQPGEVELLVKEAIADGHKRIVVAGGDGSIGEAVNGIFATDPQTELGVVPVGTGDDFAKASSIAPHWEHATALLADRLSSDAPGRPIDVGRCNDRYFVNVAGVGFDAEVSTIAKRIRLPIGDAVYFLALLRALMHGIATPRLKISFKQTILHDTFTLVSFCNGAWVGGMFQLAPDAVNDDGTLDAVCVDAVKRRRIVQLLPRLARGRHLNFSEVNIHSLRKCAIEAEAPLVWHADGEIQAPASRFEIELLPGALLLL